MFVDTSGFYCYLDADDPNHAEAVALLNAARVRLTHGYVLAELVALCESRGLPRRHVVQFVADVSDDADYQITWVDGLLHRAALQLLDARRDKTYSLCDAISFVLMRQHGVTEALTTDHHFTQEGFLRLLTP